MVRKPTCQVRLGATIRHLREARGWAQDELAHRASLHRTYIGGVERGERNISVVNICQVAKALGVHPSKLLADL
jgi:transcriptional regulator with XRE-family HTH domain